VAVSADSADGRRDGPPDSGVRGRPKRDCKRPSDPIARGAKHEAERSLRIGVGLPCGSVGNIVWRITRRPVWNTLAARAALSVAEGLAAPRRSPQIVANASRGMPVLGDAAMSGPWVSIPGDLPPLGLKTAPRLVRRALRWPGRGRKDARIFLNREGSGVAPGG
jgi:hypothetical protein